MENTEIKEGSISALIKALEIFRSYEDTQFPTHCEHDVLSFHGVKPCDVSAEDIKELNELGFLVGDPYGSDECFFSYMYGSC